jgi:hypothetical protein
MRYTNCFDKERRDFLKVVKHAGISAGLLQASSFLAGVMMSVLLKSKAVPEFPEIECWMLAACLKSTYIKLSD